MKNQLILFFIFNTRIKNPTFLSFVAVAFARLFFPAEAKVAMEIADADNTIAYTGLVSSKGSSGNLLKVDLNETPSVGTKRLQSRMQALMKTGTSRTLSSLLEG